MEQQSFRAFCPAHITGFFLPGFTDAPPLQQGSRGAGFSLAEGVTTTVAESEGSGGDLILINSRDVSAAAEVSHTVLGFYRRRFPRQLHHPLRISHVITVPQGCGFGTSGAGAFSLALALEAYLGDKDHLRAAQSAHTAEISCRTGLGTVAGQFTGGMEIRLKEGAPGIGTVETWPAAPSLHAVYTPPEPISTKEKLTDPDLRARLNEYGAAALDHLNKNRNTTLFLRESQRFALATELVPEDLRRLMEAWNEIGVTGSMLMFGRGLFSLVTSDKMKALKETTRQTADLPLLSAPLDTKGGVWL